MIEDMDMLIDKKFIVEDPWKLTSFIRGELFIAIDSLLT